MNGPQISWLPDGRRLHMNHGPIDLIVEAWGDDAEVRAAYEQAAERFQTILPELVAELPELRKQAPSPLGERSAERSGGGVRGQTAPTSDRMNIHGPTARRMVTAVAPFAEVFVTPMAAVAGSVADEMLAAMLAGRTLAKAYVNDGGDVALHLAPGNALKLSIAGTGNGFADRVEIAYAQSVRGVATSGWRGRSHSLGIADAVTVLAKDAATADAAATLIANAVDLPGHRAICRAPANSLQPDSDLGERLVTTDVGSLSADDTRIALTRGRAVAEGYIGRGLIEAAVIFLADNLVIAGSIAPEERDGTAKLRKRRRPPLSFMAMENDAGYRSIMETVS